MATIALWLITALQSIFLPLIEYFGKRALIYATVVTSFVALTGVFAKIMQSSLASVLSANVSDSLGIGLYIGLILPSNFALCVSIIINITLAKMAYNYMITLYGLSKG